VTREEARREVIELFERFAEGAPSTRCERVASHKAARAAQRARVPGDGRNFIDLKEGALASFEALRASEPGFTDFMYAVGDDCVLAFNVLEHSRLLEWLEDVEGDAWGIFLAATFPNLEHEGCAFFAAIREGYESGGIPCGISAWPGGRVSVFTGEAE
jgi:hypothetical protein